MKKFPYLLFATMIVAFSVFSSCSDDNDDDGNTNNDDPKKYLNYEYSELSTEKQKEKLQGDANAFLSEMEELKDNDALKILKEFNALLEINSPDKEFGSAEDLIRIADLYGKYTWNTSTKAWDFAESNKQTEFNFPVDGAPASITITGVASSLTQELYNGEEHLVYNGEWYEWEYTEELVATVEIPKSIAVKIYSRTSEVGTVNLFSDIKDKTTAPVKSEVSYSLGKYTMTTTVEKASPSIVKSAIKKGNKVLIDASADISGNMDNLVNEKDPGQMTGNATIKIMDAFAISGNMDVTNYRKDCDKAEENYDNYRGSDWDEAEEIWEKAKSKAFNDHTDLYLISLSDKTKIAKLVSTAKEKTYYGYTYWEETFALQFGDETVVEAEVYFSSGFDAFMNNLNKFINSFE